MTPARAREVAAKIVRARRPRESYGALVDAIESALLLFAQEAVAGETERCANIAKSVADVENAVFAGAEKRGDTARADKFKAARDAAHAIEESIRDRTTGEAG